MLRPALLTLALLLFASPASAFEVCDAAKNPESFIATDRWAVIAEKGKDDWIFGRGELMQLAQLGKSKETLSRFAAALRAKGTLPILVPVPSRLTLAEDKLDLSKEIFRTFERGLMAPMFAEHISDLRRSGWEAIDMVGLAKRSGLGAEFFNDKDHHWSTQGARLTAEEIARVVKASAMGKALTPRKFELQERDVRNPGSYRWVVLERCGVEIPAEVTTAYKAVTKQEVSSDSLLGDAPTPDVVLLGTSQSRRQDFDILGNRQYFEDSFAALLRYNLQADVANLAASGGGTFTSIDGFLTSKDFQKDKPAVIVWEMNDSEGYEEPPFLRSLVPAVHGRCSKDDAIVAASDKGDKALLTVPAGKKIVGPDHYLALKLSDKTITRLTITFDHGGVQDRVVFVRSHLLPNSGLFFSEVSPAQRKPLSSIRVDLPAGSTGRWDARLCRVP
jgi:alginate biosynthesis protein AlgX